MIKTYSLEDLWNVLLKIKKTKENELNTDLLNLLEVCKIDKEYFWSNLKEFIFTKKRFQFLKRKIEVFYKKDTPYYLLQKRTFFYGNKIKIYKGVFAPQEDTEKIIDVLEDYLNSNFFNKKKLNLLEIGSGSGAISITLGKKFLNLNISGIDINPKAVRLSRLNAKDLFLKNINFYEKNVLNIIRENGVKYDIVVCNPPYLSNKEYNKLPKKTKFQPFNSLVAKNNGMFFYNLLINKNIIEKLLVKDNFLLIIELNHILINEIKEKLNLIYSKDNFIEWSILKNNFGLERVLIIKYKK